MLVMNQKTQFEMMEKSLISLLVHYHSSGGENLDYESIDSLKKIKINLGHYLRITGESKNKQLQSFLQVIKDRINDNLPIIDKNQKYKDIFQKLKYGYKELTKSKVIGGLLTNGSLAGYVYTKESLQLTIGVFIVLLIVVYVIHCIGLPSTKKISFGSGEEEREKLS